MLPWDEFEERARQLIKMYDEPIEFINGQVKAFEEKRIAEKKELILMIYKEVFPEELAASFPIERIYNHKWENATVKEKEIRSEITAACEKSGMKPALSITAIQKPEQMRFPCTRRTWTLQKRFIT